MTSENSKTILIAAGGTGGHMSPASALAAELLSRGHKVVLATDKRGMKFEDQFSGCDIKCLPSATISGGIVGKVKSLTVLVLGIMSSLALQLKLNPDVTVGFGGYPSFPPVFAGGLLGRRVILHEQNAVLGKANAALERFAEKVALSFPLADHHETGSKFVVTGNPVRANIESLFEKDYKAPVKGGVFNVLIFGGSLGASVFSDVIPEAVSGLSSELKRKINIIQQCRPDDVERTKEAYDKIAVESMTASYMNNMDEMLEWAHLVICRSGAATVSEVTVAARPAIFVPYPGHADNQQKYNAELVSDKGGAYTVMQDDFTVDYVRNTLEELYGEPSTLLEMSIASKACATIKSAEKLADLLSL